MPSPLVLLLGPAGDPHLARLEERLVARGAEARVVDSRALPGGPRVCFSPTEETTVLGDVPLAGLTAAFVRAVPPRHPAFSVPPSSEAGYTHDEVRVAEAEGGALRDAVCAALELMWSRGFCVLNPPVAGVYEQQKPLQLSVARRAGFRIPRTLVTNDPAAGARFVDEIYAAGGECVAKPVRGGAYASLVRPGDERTSSLRRAPVILQERAPGSDVRVLLLDNEVVAAVRLEGTKAVDFRADPAYQRGDARYATIDIDVETRRSLLSVQTGLGIPFAGADLRYDEESGRYTFLEMNAAPAFLELEEKSGVDVTGVLVERLLRNAG